MKCGWVPPFGSNDLATFSRNRLTSTMPLPAPIDPTTNPHLTGVFEPVQTEIFAEDLEVVQGEIPRDLDGSYLRNGPNPRFTPLGAYVYPMEGDGMIHALSLQNGKASYRNAYVRTPMLDIEEAAGHALWPSIMSGALPGPDDVGPELAWSFRDMPAINVVCHHGTLIALAETTKSYRISPQLVTGHVDDFGGAFPQGAAAHPKVDPRTGEMVTFTYNMEAPFLQWLILNPDGSVKTGPHEVDTGGVAYMVHDFAITETKIVLSLNPAVLDIAAAMNGGSPLQWKPELGSKVAIIPRSGEGAIRWYEGEPFWVWHFANAFDSDDGVELQAVTWSNLGGGLAPGLPTPRAAYESIRLPSGGTQLSRTAIVERAMEFPRIDDRLIGSQHAQAAVGARGTLDDLPTGSFDGVLTVDTITGDGTFYQSDGLALGEPCFVPSPSGDRGGYYVSFAARVSDRSSYFLILPSDDVSTGPVATVKIPNRVPMGLHGAWIPTDEMPRP